MTGKCVKDLFDGELTAGEHQVPLRVDGELNSGVYFLTISGQDFTKSGRIVVTE